MTLNVNAAQWTKETSRPHLPVCSKQERFLFYHERHLVNPSSRLAFNVPIVLECDGELDIEALQRALSVLALRHASLRAAFDPVGSNDRDRHQSVIEYYRLTGVTTAGTFHQSISADADFQLRIIDANSSTLDAVIRSELTACIDHRTAPLARAVLARLDRCRHVLIVVIHHLIADYWSARILRRELERIYSAIVERKPLTLPEVEGQYEALAQSELKNRIAASDLSTQFWVHRWREWRARQIRYEEFCTHAGPDAGVDRITSHLGQELSADITRCARNHTVTSYIMFYAALCVLLRERTKKNQIAVWTNFSNRANRGSADTVGWLVNSHMLVSDISGRQSGAQTLKSIQRLLHTCGAHQGVALPFVWRAMGLCLESPDLRIVLDYFVKVPQRDLSSKLRTVPMFLRGLRPEAQLTFEIVESCEGFDVRLYFAKDKFTEATARELLERLTGLTLAFVDMSGVSISTY